jgi:hypothetical protein
MNFGKVIFLSFVLFAIFMGSLVFICVRQDINLVTKDYYRDELAYQTKLDKMNNTAGLLLEPVITTSDGKVTVALEGLNSVEHGTLKLYRPSDSRLDQEFEWQPTRGNSQQFVLGHWEHGLYRASMTWTVNGKEYFFEKMIVL